MTFELSPEALCELTRRGCVFYEAPRLRRGAWYEVREPRNVAPLSVRDATPEEAERGAGELCAF